MLLYNKDVQENNSKNTDYLNLLLMSKDGTSQNGDDKKRTETDHVTVSYLVFPGLRDFDTVD